MTVSQVDEPCSIAASSLPQLSLALTLVFSLLFSHFSGHFIPADGIDRKHSLSVYGNGRQWGVDRERGSEQKTIFPEQKGLDAERRLPDGGDAESGAADRRNQTHQATTKGTQKKPKKEQRKKIRDFRADSTNRYVSKRWEQKRKKSPHIRIYIKFD